MPWVLPAVAAFVAALTVTELVIIGAVIAVGIAYVMKSSITGIESAPQVPGSAYQTNPLQLTVSADAPRRMVYGKARISGVVAYMNVSGAGHEYLWMVVVIAAHKIADITQIYFDGENPVSLIPSPVGFFEWWWYNGTQTTADPQLMAAFPEWTSNCILKGCSYAVVKLKYDKAAWKNGRPNVQFDVKGKDNIRDPRTTPHTFAWTNNAALCTADFMTSPDGLGATYDEMDWETVAAAATISAQLPAELAASMCDGRYTIDGVIELAARNGDTINAMLSAGAGTIVWTEGKYRLFVGASRAFVGTITAEDLADNPSLQPRTPTDQSFNCVKGTFLDSTNNWVFSDFPPVVGTPYVTIDGGIKVFRDIVLQFTTSPITAQRLATIFLRRARLEKTITLPCKWTVFNFEVWDVVKLNLPQLGWSAGGGKLFQITDWKMMPPKSNDPGGIELTLVEYDDSIYADDITFKPVTGGGTIIPPNVTQPAPVPVLYATSGAGANDASGNPYVRFDWPVSTDIYAIGYKLAYGKYPFAPVESDYRIISGRNSSSLTVGPLKPGDVYVGYIKVLNTFEKESAATASATVLVQTIGTLPPPAVASLTSTLVGSESVDLAWAAPTAPMAYTEIRWAATNNFNNSIVIARASQPLNALRLLRETQDGYYFATFVSNAGIYGPATSVATVGRVPATIALSVTLDRLKGDLTNGIWVSRYRAVPVSQRLASELDWEVFDLMVPQPEPTVSYYSKAQTYIVNGDVRVSGALGYNRAPGIPGVLDVVPASAKVAYFASTVIKTGTFTLDADANIKVGFTVTNTDPQGVVYTAFNGIIEDL
ncbi:MAG: 20, gp20 [Marmoricola sp.]|nr:20, gp20 [Marmoricola sp.]